MSDLIDRQNAIDVLEILVDKMSDEGQTVMEQAVAVLKDLHSAEPERKWIPVAEALPEEGELVIVCSQYGAICIVKLVKGISEETRKKMKNGEIDDPCENLWCLSDRYTMSKRSDLYKEGDEFGNNQKDYAWRNGPYHYSGQEFIAWMSLPEPYRGE